ncbi:MAG: glucuronate isomerase [Clostridium sp.]|nr:glucuronate isomerase [Clostridium sp.]
MKPFMSDDFLLANDTAKALYHDHAKKMPIIDFHNHLNPKEIYEDKCYDNIADVWLGGDHYKWRAMRTFGISEETVTGKCDPYERFLAWADTIQNAIGNPLYHWTHLELQRYFGITTPLTRETAKEIWDTCNVKLHTKEFSIRNLLRMQGIEALCTTDDPVDTLEYHKLLKEDGFEIKVLPTFRPDKAVAIDKEGFADYIAVLGSIVNHELTSVTDVIHALKERLQYFIGVGCRVTDHSIETKFFVETTVEEVDNILKKRLAGGQLTAEECAKYRGYILSELGREYARNNLVMQIHIGALRNNSTRLFERLGADVGVDGVTDMDFAPQLSRLLDSMDRTNELPKVILYNLNEKDFQMLAVMIGNFQSNEEGIRGKIQLGSAWWFLDNKSGMERHFETLSSAGLVSTFVGMLTDSRSFLSFPRHEYFRRIFCNQIAKLVENGEYPDDMKYLGFMVENICYYNAKDYFRL